LYPIVFAQMCMLEICWHAKRAPRPWLLHEYSILFRFA